MSFLTYTRMEELFKGCAYCEGNIEQADCTCIDPDEVRKLVKNIRALEAEVHDLEDQRDTDYAADERVLKEAGHLSFTAMLADYKHLREENERLHKDYQQALESLRLAEKHSDQFASDLRALQAKLDAYDKAVEDAVHGPPGNNARHPLDMD